MKEMVIPEDLIPEILQILKENDAELYSELKSIVDKAKEGENNE